jgi:nucleoside-diphosphate-sugar epimerase
MRVLVTGGSGFIGTSLVGELLKAHHQVTIFDKDMSSKYPDLVVVGDVRDKDAIIKAASRSGCGTLPRPIQVFRMRSPH